MGSGFNLMLDGAVPGHVENCIICSNLYGANYAIPATVPPSFSNCCMFPALTGTATNYSANNITVPPQFVNWQAGDYRLARGSSCINAGVTRDWMTNTVDLGGRRRIDRFSGKVDIGCYEYSPSGTMISVR